MAADSIRLAACHFQFGEISVSQVHLEKIYPVVVDEREEFRLKNPF